MSAPGNQVNISFNTQTSLEGLYAYDASQNGLEQADMQLQANISNDEVNASTNFETEMNSPTGPDNYLFQLQQLAQETNPPSTQSTQMQELETEYNNANTENQQQLQVYNSQLQMYQGTSSQIPQSQGAITNGFSGVIGIEANLNHLVSSMA